MGKNNNGNRHKSIMSLFLLFLVLLALMTRIASSMRETETFSYDDLVVAIKAGEVSKVTAYKESEQVIATFADGTQQQLIVPSMEEFSKLITNELENGNQIEFKIESSSNVFLSLLPSLLMICFYVFLFRSLSKSMGGGNDYTVKPVTSTKRFSDVAGIDEEKKQLEEVVTFLKHPEKYTRKGAKIPRGILLSGDPGTGKTLLAKAIAGEAGVPFFQASGSTFEEKFVGVGASRVRKLFAEAKKVAPCIIFIDEIDAVAQNRYSGRSYTEQTLNQLLAEMDGFSTDEKVIVIAATNHIEVLDSAITRPGRFDRHVFVPKPDVIAREKILQLHARNKCLSNNVSLHDVAKRTTGFSGADLENILNEAAINSVNNMRECITVEDIEEAIARVMVGLKKPDSAITPEEKWLTAVHEAGHAVVSAVVRPSVKNFGISIVPRGQAGGYNVFDEPDNIYMTKKALDQRMQVLYGGRLAEEIILSDISSGASNDLEKASQIAHLMITRFSMNGGLLSKISGEADFNQQLDNKSVQEAEGICRKNYETAKSIVENHIAQINNLAKLLIEKEYLSQQEVAEFIEKNF